MKPFAASPTNINSIQFSIKEPVCIIRQLNHLIQPLNPGQIFEGIYVHFPLEMIQLYNQDMSLAIDTFFINCNGIDKWFIAPGEAKIVTICLPWQWINTHYNYNEYLILRKKSHLDLIVTSVSISAPNIRDMFSDFQGWVAGYPKIPALKTLENLLNAVFDSIFTVVFPKKNKKARLVSISQNNSVIDTENTYNNTAYTGISNIDQMDENAKIKAVFDKYVNNPGRKMPSLVKIAKEINMPSLHLKYQFKKLYGKHIQALHIEIKFKYGMELLEKGYKVSDVSKALCYTQPSKFVSTFKKIYNVTPGQITKHTKYI